ncbi:MAG TPA: PqqD family peptide modification chaperone [Leptolinea sp.]
MKQISNLRERFFPKTIQLPSGFFPYQSPAEIQPSYRLQLRLDKDGTGILVINAKTVLHLNQTAAELAYHLVKGDSTEKAVRAISKRYNVSRQQVLEDAQDFQERIRTTIETPGLDPVTFLDFERVDPYSTDITAPYRLDCALTYKTGEESAHSAPIERVKRELVTEEWKNILQKAWQVGIPQIVFTGGEPTIRPDLCELIAITQNQGQVTGLLTNGNRLAEREFLHSLIQSGLDHVMIVLDPDNSQTWEAIRDVSNEDLFMTVHLTFSKRMIGHAGEILQKLEKNMGEKRSLSLSVDHSDLTQELAEIRNQAVKLGFHLVWDLPVPYSAMNPVAIELEKDGEQAKGAGNAWLYVEPDGDVLPAQGINKVLGNLLTDPWENIWNKRL